MIDDFKTPVVTYWTAELCGTGSHPHGASVLMRLQVKAADDRQLVGNLHSEPLADYL